jgi:trk system potassium uptake protein TrkA
MKIVIAGGSSEADYLVRMLQRKNHQLVIINNDRDYCEYLSNLTGIAVFYGDPSKDYVLSDAHAHQADVLIALTESDADNLIICQLGKRLFSIRRCVATVTNPKNVDVFRRLGINHALSATYLIAQNIERASMIDNLINTVSMEEDRIVINEIEVKSDSHLVGKTLRDLKPDFDFNISCIFRSPAVIIPNGSTKVEANDKLVLVAAHADQDRIIEYVKKVK